MTATTFIVDLDGDTPEMRGWLQLDDPNEREYEIWRDREGNQYRLELMEDGLGRVTQIDPSESDYQQ